MTRRTVVISIIAVLVTVGFGTAIVIQTENHRDRLQRVDAKFRGNPTAKNLRKLLKSPSDGEDSYLKMAMVGHAFGNHPNLMREVANDIQHANERRAIELVSTLGSRVFEYYPELEPPEFDQVYQQHRWLKNFRTP